MQFNEHSIYYLEIVTPDVESMCNMYEKSAGWKFSALTHELGNARITHLPEGILLGIRAPMHETEKPTVRTYLRVSDIDIAVRNAEQSGANILLERMEIPGRGIIAIYEHGGIQHGFWQAD